MSPPLLRTACDITPSAPSRDQSRQAANELLAHLIDEADRNRYLSFTSDQAAAWLSFRGYPRRYVQKMLSRLGQRGHLFTYKGPRPVRGGCNRGVRNFYVVTPRGRDRALWWRRSYSMLGINYLASGTGNPSEVIAAMGLKILSPLIPNGPDSWTFRSRDPESIGFLLTNLSNDITYSFSFSGWDSLLWVERLKDTGLVPRHINPPMFHFIAKTYYQQPDALTLISTLYKSITHWKRRCETLERELDSRHWQDEVRSLHEEIGHVSSEQLLANLATERREYSELLAQQRMAYHKLQLDNESQKATLRDVFHYLKYVSDSLNELTDAVKRPSEKVLLIPMKMHIQHSLWIANLAITFS